MFSRSIGRIVAVDSFRVIVELDSSIKGTQKSGYHDIYEVAKINSYIILPVGNEKIVAIVTRVKTFDENEFEKIAGGIKFPKSIRHIIATMIGTITDDKYIEGIYNYPVLDNPVWYIIKEDLEKIFDDINKGGEFNYEKDFYLPIGKASNFTDYDVKINPDKFFNKHSAVLGNTGSGKSCTITSILQSLFEYDYDGKSLKSANIIILDTNGEYKKTFNKLSSVNSFSITEEGLKIPYWFMNYEDFEHIFEPSAGTQAPILKKALGILKEGNTKIEDEVISRPILNKLNQLLNGLEENNKNMKQFILNDLDDLINTINKLIIPLKEENAFRGILTNIQEILESLNNAKIEGKLIESFGIKGTISSLVVVDSYNKLNNEINLYLSKIDVKNSQGIDKPKYFNFSELIKSGLEEAISDLGGNQGKNREYISTLKLRLSSFLSDERKAEPLMLKEDDFENSLVIFLNYLLGNPLDKNNEDLFTKYRAGVFENNSDKKSQITIIDLSLLPYELLETITGLIGRLILEFSQRINKVSEYKRGSMPITIVLEEAQNYIPEINYNGKKSISKKIFERIAREGRKYGVSLIISSQRPSELSKTILSQCNTFIVHRLQNPEDQKYIKQMVSSANSDLLNQLPVLPQQHAIIMGDAVRTPTQLKINDITEKPDSSNPKYIDSWLKEKNNIEVSKVVEEWLK